MCGEQDQPNLAHLTPQQLDTVWYTFCCDMVNNQIKDALFVSLALRGVLYRLDLIKS